MLVIAHRGASAYLPENTLPAFERAIEQGADFVEFDVHNDLEVTHDRPVRGVVYPTLAEVLDLCHGRIGVMVELKRPRGDTVRRALALMRDDDVFVCFQRRAIEHVGLGVSIRRAASGWAVGFRNDRLTRRGLETARGYGLETTVYTVNDVARIAELGRLGVTGVFTDYPDRALATLGRRSAG